jgi:hypothetical protein
VSSRRKAPLAPSSLTSLVDVLFILVFAALVQRTSVATGAQREDEPVVAAAGAVDGDGGNAAAPRWQPPPQVEELRQAAISRVAAELQDRPAIVARVSARGVLTSLEVATAGLADALAPVAPGAGSAAAGSAARRALALELPLVEAVADPDVAVGYVGDRDDRQRLCSVMAMRLGGMMKTAGPFSLSRALVVIAVDAPLSQLMVALVGGLRRDVEHCLMTHQAVAVLLDRAAMDQLSPVDATEALDGRAPAAGDGGDGRDDGDGDDSGGDGGGENLSPEGASR